MEADTSAPARFSRYRSVRKAASREEPTVPVPDLPRTTAPQVGQGPANRAPSRYRRPAATRIQDVPLPSQPIPAVVSATQLPSRYRNTTTKPQPIPKSAIVNDTSPPLPQVWPKTFQQRPQVKEEPRRPEETLHTPVARSVRPRSKTQTSPRDRPITARRSYDAAREEARLILEGEYDRLHRLKKQQEKAEKERKLRAEAKVAAQRAEEARAEEARALKSQSQTREPQEQPRKTRKWTIGAGSGDVSTTHPAPQSPSTPQTIQPIPELNNHASPLRMTSPQDQSDFTEPKQQTLVHANVDVPSSRTRERRPTQSRPSDISRLQSFEAKVGAGPPKTAVNGPQATVDAPVSAVNAGERRVEVRFEKSKITLPITPSTTVKDLLNSASVVMSQPIDPRTAVLVETYSPLGLERPLRRYEHIRDVMNSWDGDTQNYLMILPQSSCSAVGLEQKEAPVEQPSLTMLHMLHSQRPGKWEKHWMILKPDGQVTASSKENDGNAPNVFHLSDFDVYMPTKKEKKKLRPPKKICFAIKSQQRSIMFENTKNFVHFFSTNDKTVADQWYNAVQAWRSWYMVNVLNQGTNNTVVPPPKDALAAAAINNNLVQRRPSTSHSRDSVPYQLGTFQPLLEFDAGAFTYGERQEAAKRLTEAKSAGSPTRQKTLVDHARTQSITNAKTNGLERHMTTKRQTPPTSFPKHESRPSQSATPPAPPSSTDAAFTGTGLLARAYTVKKAQAEENAAYLEKPDNAFTGKGLLSRKISTKRFGHENPNPGIIVDTAEGFTGGLLSRKMSTKKLTPAAEELYPGVIQDTNEAFTGAGLLNLQRTLTKKKSAVSTRPGQPLVDLAGSSAFEDGSLLRNVEGWQIATGQAGPVIDRSKGIEVKDKTGEF